MDCIVWLLILAMGIGLMLSLIRWFEQVTEAVRSGWWNKTFLLVLFPPACWFFPSRVSAGRPTAVPLHEPVRGFGGLGKIKIAEGDDGPPPGTPKEFLEKPKVPPKKPRASSGVDPDKIARLKQKMKEQGMMDEES